MANQISILVEAKNNASATLATVGNEIQGLGNKADEAAPKSDRFGSSLGVLGSRVRFVAETFAIYGVGKLITDFATSAVSASGELEQTNVSFQNLIGNAQEANKVFGELTQYANVTPFQSKDVTDAAKQLLAFGQTGDQVVGTVKQLGDVASAGGGDLQALSLVTGQIFAQGKLRAQDMYQVINDGGAGLIKVMAANAGGMQKLTAEFDAGGIPAQQYFDAINQATGKGGFAFQGAQKQAETFNGRLSTLKDSATQFGEALIGVHTDPQLGLQIQPGGLFDRLRNGILNISDTLQSWQPAVQAAVPQFIDRVHKLWDQIANYLGPSFDGLWKTIRDQVLPTLSDLWHNVIEPLIPVLGGALVLAIKLVVDMLDGFLKVASPLLDFLANHTWVLWGLVGVFGTLATVMAFNAVFDALTVGFNTLTLITIPGVMASVEALQAVISTPVIFGAIAIGAALIALDQVYNAAQKTKQAINDALSAQAKAADQAPTIKYYEQQYQAGKISKTQETNAINAILKGVDSADAQANGHALGTLFAPGGLSLVGENGPELVNLPRGSQVTPTNQTQQMLGGNRTVHIENFNTYNNVDANAVIRKIGFRLATA